MGRPIIYSGDPDAPNLTPQERRRIRRRIANRESARRVRAKRQDLIEEMSIKVCTPVHPNSLRGTPLLLGVIYIILAEQVPCCAGAGHSHNACSPSPRAQNENETSVKVDLARLQLVSGVV